MYFKATHQHLCIFPPPQIFHTGPVCVWSSILVQWWEIWLSPTCLRSAKVVLEPMVSYLGITLSTLLQLSLLSTHRWNVRTRLCLKVFEFLFPFLQGIFHRERWSLFSVSTATFLIDATSGNTDRLPVTHFSESLRRFWDRRYILLHWQHGTLHYWVHRGVTASASIMSWRDGGRAELRSEQYEANKPHWM